MFLSSVVVNILNAKRGGEKAKAALTDIKVTNAFGSDGSQVSRREDKVMEVTQNDYAVGETSGAESLRSKV
jgi:dTDP-4-amino-4,6-dideoxygalactose transaminase